MWSRVGVGTQIEQILGKTQTIEGKIEEHNAKIEKDIADIFDMIQLLSHNQNNTS